MRALVLWADDRSPNLGVRALAAGHAALVAQCWPGASVTFHNFGAREAPVRVGSLRAAVRERVTGRGGLIDWLASFDTVIDTRSGDSFADIYGLRRLSVMTLMADAAIRARVPLLMGPQTIGPFTSHAGRRLGAHSLKVAAGVIARDSASAWEASRIGRAVDVVATDVVFALPVPSPSREFDVLLNVSGLLWNSNPHVPSEHYRAIIVQVLTRLLQEGRQVTLLAHVLASSSPDNDEPAIASLRARFGDSLDVLIPKSLDEVRSAVAGASVTIGSRMHACLNSLSVGTPAIPLAYSRKFAPLLSDLGWLHTVDLRQDADPVGHLMTMVGDPSGLGESSAAVVGRAQELLAPVVSFMRATTTQRYPRV